MYVDRVISRVSRALRKTSWLGLPQNLPVSGTAGLALAGVRTSRPRINRAEAPALRSVCL